MKNAARGEEVSQGLPVRLVNINSEKPAKRQKASMHASRQKLMQGVRTEEERCWKHVQITVPRNKHKPLLHSLVSMIQVTKCI